MMPPASRATARARARADPSLAPPHRTDPTDVQGDGTGKCYPQPRLQGPGLMRWVFPHESGMLRVFADVRVLSSRRLVSVYGPKPIQMILRMMKLRVIGLMTGKNHLFQRHTQFDSLNRGGWCCGWMDWMLTWNVKGILPRLVARAPNGSFNPFSTSSTADPLFVRSPLPFSKVTSHGHPKINQGIIRLRFTAGQPGT